MGKVIGVYSSSDSVLEAISHKSATLEAAPSGLLVLAKSEKELGELPHAPGLEVVFLNEELNGENEAAIVNLASSFEQDAEISQKGKHILARLGFNEPDAIKYQSFVEDGLLLLIERLD